MAETNFTLHSTDTNNYSVQKTFSGVNPEATSAALVETAKGFNRLTDNTYVGTKRINKFNADTEDGGASKITPTLTLDDSWHGGDNNNHQLLYSYSGDGTVCFYAIAANDNEIFTKRYYSSSASSNGVYLFWQESGISGSAVTIIASAPETDNYKAVSVSKTLTW